MGRARNDHLARPGDSRLEPVGDREHVGDLELADDDQRRGGDLGEALARRRVEPFGLGLAVSLRLVPWISLALAGTFGVYAGCAPGKADEVLALAREELSRVADDGITDEEIRRGKGMLKGSLVLGLEDTGSRMSRLGKGELLYDELLTVDQVLTAVDSVTPDEVRDVARDVYGGQPSLAVIGRFAAHTGPHADHPFGGRLDRETWGVFHAAHAAHHLSFAVPTEVR